MRPLTRLYWGGGLLLYALVSLVISLAVVGKPPNLFTIGAAAVGTWWVVRGSRDRAEEEAANAAEAERRRLANPNWVDPGERERSEPNERLVLHTLAYVAGTADPFDDKDVAFVRGLISRISGRETSTAQTRKLMEEMRAETYLGLPQFASLAADSIPSLAKRHLIRAALSMWAQEDPPNPDKRARIANVALTLDAHVHLFRALYEFSNPEWRRRSEKAYPPIINGNITFHATLNAAQFVARADGAIDTQEIEALRAAVNRQFGTDFTPEEAEQLLCSQSYGDFLEDPAFDAHEDIVAAAKGKICAVAFLMLYAGGTMNEARLEAVKHVAAVLDAREALADMFSRAAQIVEKPPN